MGTWRMKFMRGCPISSGETRQESPRAAQELPYAKPVASCWQRNILLFLSLHWVLSGTAASQFSSLICQKLIHFLLDCSVNLAGWGGPQGQISISVNRRRKWERRTKSIQEADLVMCCFVKLHPSSFATQARDEGRNSRMATQDLQVYNE